MSHAKLPPVKVQKRGMWSRMLKAARFDSATFIDLKLDQRANGQAVAVLTLASLSYGIGSAFLIDGQDSVQSPARFLPSTLVWTIWFFLMFSSFSITAFLVGTRLLKGTTSFTGLARPVFFSTSPGPLFLLLSIPSPDISNSIRAALSGWVLVAGVYAVKHAMGFSIQKSMLAFIIFVLVWFAILGVALGAVAVYLIGGGA